MLIMVAVIDIKTGRANWQICSNRDIHQTPKIHVDAALLSLCNNNIVSFSVNNDLHWCARIGIGFYSGDGVLESLEQLFDHWQPIPA